MAARASRWLSGRLGCRGPFLLFMGVGEVALGASFIFDPPLPMSGLALLLRWAPLHCWAWLWVLAGAATFVSAWLPFTRDGWGFVAASVPPALWAFAYGWAGLADHYSRGLWIFVWYMTSHCGVIWCASRVPPAERGRPG